MYSFRGGGQIWPVPSQASHARAVTSNVTLPLPPHVRHGAGTARHYSIRNARGHGRHQRTGAVLTTRVIAGGPSYPYCVAIVRGPQVLALEQSVNKGMVDLQAAGPLTSELKLRDAESALPPRWHGTQAYELSGEVAGKPQELVLVPFSDARVYRVWLLKP